MPEDHSQPYNRRGGRTVAQRNADRAAAAFYKTPTGKMVGKLEGEIAKFQGDLAKAKKDLEDLQRFNREMDGDDVIKINGSKFTANLTGRGAGQSTPTSAFPQKFFGVRGGAFHAWLIPAQDTEV